MNYSGLRSAVGGARWVLLAIAVMPLTTYAGAPSAVLPAATLHAGAVPAAPVANAAFSPDSDAGAAPEFSGRLSIRATPMQTAPALAESLIVGRDARQFPSITLEFFSDGGRLVPVERGTMVAETAASGSASYWRVIPQFGRVWREPGDGDWARAAFPLMLVNDTENHAHQGLATFLYKNGAVTALQFQFVQQTAPYMLKQHLVAWGVAPMQLGRGDGARLAGRRVAARAELARRLPAKPWQVLADAVPAGTLDGFGGPLLPSWIVVSALVRDGVLYYQDAPTPYGNYPYPLEMRFGVRSIMKSVGAPLALLRLAEVYGPYVFALNIGDYVPGLDPKYRHVRFMDAASMASGFGGTGSVTTHPNDLDDGYLGADYDAWYTAPSHAEKIAQIAKNWRPYPWEPGTVMRYRDQDYYLLGIALDRFVKSVRGSQADVWQMLQQEVFTPIGIDHAPAVRTREADGRDGAIWFNAGYYPTLDDLAKIALLYQDLGAHAGRQILHRQLTAELLAAKDALYSAGDASVAPSPPAAPGDQAELYKWGFHFFPYVGSRSRQRIYLPTMQGSGQNEVVLYPNRMISLRMAKAARLPEGETEWSDKGPQTAQAVDRLLPF